MDENTFYTKQLNMLNQDLAKSKDENVKVMIKQKIEEIKNEIKRFNNKQKFNEIKFNKSSSDDSYSYQILSDKINSIHSVEAIKSAIKAVHPEFHDYALDTLAGSIYKDLDIQFGYTRDHYFGKVKFIYNENEYSYLSENLLLVFSIEDLYIRFKSDINEDVMKLIEDKYRTLLKIFVTECVIIEYKNGDSIRDKKRIDYDSFIKIVKELNIPKNIDISQLYEGTIVELEHGTESMETNIIDDDLEKTIKIAWRHLKELPDYYVRLKKMEDEGRQFFGEEK